MPSAQLSKWLSEIIPYPNRPGLRVRIAGNFGYGLANAQMSSKMICGSRRIDQILMR